MSTTIESLELEIVSNSNSAVSGIDNLTQSLTKLKSATKGGLGLGSVSKNLTSVATAANSINPNAVSNVSGLAKAIQLLSGTKISTTIASQITEISKSLQNADFASSKGKMEDLVNALSPLQSLGKTNLSSYVTNLKKLPQVLKELQRIDMASLKTKIEEVATSLKPLGDAMQKISTGFSSFPTKIQKILNATDKIPSSNKKAASSFTDLYYAIKSVVDVAGQITKALWSTVKKSNDYVENVNLFTVSMGKYASSAMEYAEEVSNAMGIDTSEWIRNQGIFMTMATGFGVAGDRAAKMSQNLTQLGYDIASFYNTDVDTAMQKLKSGLAGELEPLRAIGYDLSQAKLEATALELGISKSVSSMTQAEKAQLRYYAILSQVTTAHGDMARTLQDPANQLRVLREEFNMATREIGNLFIPALNAILPYAIALMRVIRSLANSIAGLFGIEATDINDSMGNVVTNTDAVQENLEGAKEEAKKLKSYMLGIDELNVINPNEGNASSNNTNTSGWVDFELPSYDFKEGLKESKIAEIVEELKEWLGITGEIDEWSDLFETRLGRILTSVGSVGGALLLWKLSETFLKNLDTLSTVVGLTLLIDSVLLTFQEGLSWESIIGGALGGALAGAGIGYKLGGVPGAIGGLIIGVGLSLLINGITSMFAEGVDIENVAATIIGLLTTVGGIITVVKLFNKTHKSPVKEFNTTADTMADVSTGMSKVTSKLKSLATNLGLGLVIILEVAAAAIITVGAIWVLGKELEQVGIAWQPVIDNGATIAIAIGLGTALLVGVGVATGLLGTLGGAMAGQMAIGIAILAEMGVATALFIAEIWLIGKGLDEVGKAWQPVIDNGETIATGIGLGTALLIGIGVVTAALGAATVASVGALPIAIGLGTALLIEMTAAFVLFTAELIIIANQLSEELHPALENTSAILPGLTENMGEFTSFMGDFAWEVVKYSASSTIAGIAATIDKIIGFFTTDPVTAMADEVDSQNKEFEYLIAGLEIIIPHIEYATDLVNQYNDAMGSFDEASGANKGLLGNLGIARDAINKIISGIESLANGVINGINGMINALNSMSFDVPDWVPIIGGEKFGLNISTLSTISIPRFANGGFPEQGQMFIANEAGAEMVGNIGRRTAVANNDQIVESISGGVAEANEEQNALLREQNSLLRAILEKDSGVYLDGKNLTNSVEKYQHERGRVLITGGVI